MTSNESEVLYARFDDAGWEVSNLEIIAHLFEEFVGKSIHKGERILLKTHFGQWGNLQYLRPSIIRLLVDLIKDKGALVSVGETTGLGYDYDGKFGGRGTASDYITMAARHGFDMGTLGAPIIMLDGELGVDTFSVAINGEYVQRVDVGRGALHFDKIIMVTHGKGHPNGGIGGSIKNLGIGMVGKYSKAMAHRGQGISIDQNKCLGSKCQKCLQYCPKRCISMNENGNSVQINTDECVYCQHCMDICRTVVKQKAISMPWIQSDDEQSRRWAENAAGVIKGLGPERIYYLQFVMDISPMCDCVPATPYFMTSDIGLLAGRDPVAIDQAMLDLINNAPSNPNSPIAHLSPGEDKIAHIFAKSNADGTITLATKHLAQLEQASKIGIGLRLYSLKEIVHPKIEKKHKKELELTH